jgi:hypothetical protein
MKRPLGVVLTSVVLGLFAAIQLLCAVLVVFAGFALSRAGAVPASPAYPAGVAPPSAGFIAGIMAGIGLFYVLLALWAVVTIVGLIRMRNWGRYSVLVIGGCLAALGLMSLLGIVIIAAVAPSLPGMPPSASPHLMQGILIFEGVILSGIAAIGVWWLVYFNLPTTKAAFVAPMPPPYDPAFAAYPAPYALDPSTFPDLPAPPPPYVAPPPSFFTGIPVAVIVLAAFFLFGALSCLGFTFVPIPGFFCGFIFTGFPVHLLYFALAISTGAIGYGLLRLDNRARLGTYAMMVFGIVQFGILVSPWGHARYLAYNALLQERMHTPASAVPMAAIYTRLMVYIIVPFCILFYGAQVWILEHYRAAFRRTKTTPIP